MTGRGSLLRELTSKGARGVVVGVVFFLGALFAIGAVLAARFEIQGFPPQPGQPRAWYLAALAAGLLASVTAPFVVSRLLLPEIGRRIWWPAAAAVAAAFAVFGLAIVA